MVIEYTSVQCVNRVHSTIRVPGTLYRIYRKRLQCYNRESKAYPQPTAPQMSPRASELVGRRAGVGEVTLRGMERLDVFWQGSMALYAPDETALQYTGTVNVLLSSQMDLHTGF